MSGCTDCEKRRELIMEGFRSGSLKVLRQKLDEALRFTLSHAQEHLTSKTEGE